MHFRAVQPGIQGSEFGVLCRPGAVPSSFPHSALRTPRSSAFTLIELLVVLAIIGVLAAIGLPAMRGMTGSHAIIAGNRQFVDDLAFARQTAIAQHTTVYLVFVPTNMGGINVPVNNPTLARQITNLYTARYTTYALLSLRQVGDQPGRSTPKYLTDWRSLPNGVFIPPSKFAMLPPSSLGPGFSREFGLPFPMATNSLPNNFPLPCLIFNYLGQLTDPSGTVFDQYIPLARGSIFYNPGNPAAAPDIQENPPGNDSNNIIYVNALTGRARIVQPQIQ
jgi:prepilin-type N-terminal cleavage/methylation domain-containing protein